MQTAGFRARKVTVVTKKTREATRETNYLGEFVGWEGEEGKNSNFPSKSQDTISGEGGGWVLKRRKNKGQVTGPLSQGKAKEQRKGSKIGGGNGSEG